MAAIVVVHADKNYAPLPHIQEARELFAGHLPCDDPWKLRQVYRRLALRYHPDKRPAEDRIAATQLFQAIGAAYEELLKASDPNSGQPHKRVMSPAAAAAEQGNIAELRRLISERPECVNELDDLGVSPLMFAAAGGNVEAAELLLDSGADIHLLSPINWSALLYAALGNHAPMVRFLVGRGANVTAHELILAAYTGNPDSLDALLELYTDSVSAIRTDQSQKTLLHLACEGMFFLRHSAERHAQCVELILKKRIPINERESERQRTCLQDFVGDRRWTTRGLEDSYAHMRIVERLCEAGASVTIEDAEGGSAISIAADNSLSHVRGVLLNYA